jgi:hypothetical protein
MTKSGVNKLWQVFEWKHIISTSNSQLKGNLPHEQGLDLTVGLKRVKLKKNEKIKRQDSAAEHPALSSNTYIC